MCKLYIGAAEKLHTIKPEAELGGLERKSTTYHGNYSANDTNEMKNKEILSISD